MEFCKKCKNHLKVVISNDEFFHFCCICNDNFRLVDPYTMITYHAEVEYKEISIERKVSLPFTKERCAKCDNEEAYYFELQTRSADEPTTIFYTCKNKKCSFKWKA